MDQKCILVTFIRFWNTFEKYWKLAKIWAKNGRFLRFSRQILKKKVWRKVSYYIEKIVQLSWNLAKMLLARVPLYKFTRAFFDILIIFQLMDFRIEQNGYFGQFLIKYRFCSILKPISSQVTCESAMRNGPRLRAISIMYSFFSKKIQKVVFDLQKFHKSGPTSVGFNWKKKKKLENVFYVILSKKKYRPSK